MRKKLFFLALGFLEITTNLCALEQTKHKIVYLISPPRSLSTVFLRMMGNRTDFEVLNEPGQYYYCKTKKDPKVVAYIFKDTMPDSIESLKNLILEKAKTSHVFIKDIAWYMEDSIINDLDFIQRDNVFFLFPRPS